MKLVVFGLTVTSSWGNGHATLWRGLCRALAAAGHEIVFCERDVPYYARHRDLQELPGATIHLYPEWNGFAERAAAELADADVGMVTSYCPDALAATDLLLDSPVGQRVFYDLDTPVTLGRLAAGEQPEYIGHGGLSGFDRVLSYTGGPALEALVEHLGAREAAPLYGSVDPSSHHPAPPIPEFAGRLSYLGTWAADRQAAFEDFFLEPARRCPDVPFVLGGSMYPRDLPRPPNVRHHEHVPPPSHPAFYGSSPLTLNITRGAMVRMGWCPSGRLFEAAACGVTVLTDWFEGLDAFFEPGSEILVARSADDVVAALELPDERLAAIGAAARRRALSDHTAERRAAELLAALGTPVPFPATSGAAGCVVEEH